MFSCRSRVLLVILMPQRKLAKNAHSITLKLGSWWWLQFTDGICVVHIPHLNVSWQRNGTVTKVHCRCWNGSCPRQFIRGTMNRFCEDCNAELQQLNWVDVTNERTSSLWSLLIYSSAVAHELVLVSNLLWNALREVVTSRTFRSLFGVNYLWAMCPQGAGELCRSHIVQRLMQTHRVLGNFAMYAQYNACFSAAMLQNRLHLLTCTIFQS